MAVSKVKELRFVSNGDNFCICLKSRCPNLDGVVPRKDSIVLGSCDYSSYPLSLSEVFCWKWRMQSVKDLNPLL